MKIIGGGRVRRDESEWRELIGAWKQSGQSARSFCHARGVQVASFQRWRQRLSEAYPKQDFLPVVTEPTDTVAPSWSLEVKLPNGVSLRFQA
jgi:hypothetical protein